MKRALLVLVALNSASCGAGSGGDASTPPSAPTSNPPSVETDPDASRPGPTVDGGSYTPVTLLASRGANLDAAGGVVFRVWAPNATAAWVTGDFPEAKVAMTAGTGGLHEAHVKGAHVGSTYAFSLETPSGILARIDPYCRDIAADRTRCRVVEPKTYAWKTSAFTRPAREAAVAYEMHVGSFTEQGTLAAARARLGELAELGINVVELMPVHAFGASAHTWGYNPQLWLAPKPELGSADELRNFVDEAHGKGIAVWIDFVVNHADGWSKAPLRCYDGHCPNNSAGIYFFPNAPYASTPWGPRPDYTQPESAGMILASVEQWLTEYRGDGFRWDSVSNIRALDGKGTTPGGRDLLVQANELTHTLGGLSIAEDLKGEGSLTLPAQKNGFGFDAQWDGFGYDLGNVIAQASDDARDMGTIERLLRGGYGGDPYARLLWLENHDTVGNGGSRLPVRIDSANPQSLAARRRSMLAAVMLLTTPGVPMLFMGQEGLATQGFTNPPPPLAAPTATGAKIRSFYKDAIALRHALPSLQAAPIQILHRNDAAKVIAFRRGDAIVILNFRNHAYPRYDIGAPVAGPYNVRLNTESKLYGGDDFSEGQTGSIATVSGVKDGQPRTLPLALPAYGAMILTP